MDKNKKNKLINFDEYNDKLFTYSTSKGNLPKWNVDNFWYKIDAFGYESLSEYIISNCLAKSNINNYVKYEVVKGIYNNKECNFSKSEDFLQANENIITFHRLYYALKGDELSKAILKYNDPEDKIKFTADFVSEATKLQDICEYINECLQIDMLFLNEDRHFNNLAVIRNKEADIYKLAPIFDNGLSLLSDTYEYHDVDIYKDIDKVKGKPFSRSLEEQCEAAEKLYGTNLKFDFDKHDIESMLNAVSMYYDTDTIDRVRKIIFEQMRKYQYLF